MKHNGEIKDLLLVVVILFVVFGVLYLFVFSSHNNDQKNTKPKIIGNSSIVNNTIPNDNSPDIQTDKKSHIDFKYKELKETFSKVSDPTLIFTQNAKYIFTVNEIHMRIAYNMSDTAKIRGLFKSIFNVSGDSMGIIKVVVENLVTGEVDSESRTVWAVKTDPSSFTRFDNMMYKGGYYRITIKSSDNVITFKYIVLPFRVNYISINNASDIVFHFSNGNLNSHIVKAMAYANVTLYKYIYKDRERIVYSTHNTPIKIYMPYYEPPYEFKFFEKFINLPNDPMIIKRPAPYIFSNKELPIMGMKPFAVMFYDNVNGKFFFKDYVPKNITEMFGLIKYTDEGKRYYTENFTVGENINVWDIDTLNKLLSESIINKVKTKGDTKVVIIKPSISYKYNRTLNQTNFLSDYVPYCLNYYGEGMFSVKQRPLVVSSCIHNIKKNIEMGKLTINFTMPIDEYSMFIGPFYINNYDYIYIPIYILVYNKTVDNVTIPLLARDGTINYINVEPVEINMTHEVNNLYMQVMKVLGIKFDYYH